MIGPPASDDGAVCDVRVYFTYLRWFLVYAFKKVTITPSLYIFQKAGKVRYLRIKNVELLETEVVDFFWGHFIRCEKR